MYFVQPVLTTAQTELLARVCLGAAEDQWFDGTTAEQLTTLAEFFTHMTKNPTQYPVAPKLASKVRKTVKRAQRAARV